MLLETPDEYIAVLILGAVIELHYYLTAFIAGSKRKFFNKEFMESNFSDVHLEAFPNSKLSIGGLPDMGSGRYS